MLDKIILWAGTESSTFAVPTSPVTLFIGPNNSGKTLLLKEMSAALRRDQTIGRGVSILRDLEYRFPDPEDMELLFRGVGGRRVPTRKPVAPEDPNNDAVHIGRTLDNGTEWLVSTSLRGAVAGRNLKVPELARLLSLNLALGPRLGILDPHKGQHGILAHLAKDPAQSEALSELLHDAIGWHFSVEWRPGHSPRAMLNRQKIPPELAQSYSDKAGAFHAKGKPLREFSEGIQSFVGLLAAYLWADLRVFVIDEPEAFLHPPLARTLGRLLAEQSRKMKATTVAATHSPELLMGCVQSGTPTSVVRLTYENEVASFRLLDANDLGSFMHEPRLRSTGALNALFHRCAIVTEADVDRAFYEEANLRLLAEDGGSGGAEECCFLNVNGQDSVERVVCLLRKMGLPTVAIVDLDMLETDSLMPLLQAANLPESARSMVAAAKPKLIEAFGGKPAKECGTAGASDPRAVEGVLDTMADYGVFLVPVGALERWLPHLGVKGPKQSWLSQIFERMGSDPASPDYVRPTEGDVWAFLRRIATWLRDPNRKGMAG